MTKASIVDDLQRDPASDQSASSPSASKPSASNPSPPKSLTIGTAGLAPEKPARGSHDTEARQRQSFWNALPRAEQDKLSAICPYFDPQHDVWTKSQPDQYKRAQKELSRIISVADAMEWRRVMVVILNPLVLLTTALIYTPIILVLSRIGFITLWATDICYQIVLALHLIGWVSALFSAVIEPRFPESSYSPVSRYCGRGVTPLSETELQYSKNWAALHRWRFKKQERYVSDGELWETLTSLVSVGAITTSEGRQIFWDSRSDSNQAHLAKVHPLFDVGHKVWTGSSVTKTRVAELELELVAASWVIDDKISKLAIMMAVFSSSAVAFFAAKSVWGFSKQPSQAGLLTFLRAGWLMFLPTGIAFVASFAPACCALYSARNKKLKLKKSLRRRWCRARGRDRSRRLPPE